MQSDVKQRNYKPMIIIVTVILVSAITALLRLPGIDDFNAFDITILPLINAILNVLSFFLLLGALIAILKGYETLHKRLIYTAVITTSLFLITYVVFHTIASATPFGGEGFLKFFYYFILITHITLAISIIPLALTSITSTWNQQFEFHKKVSRWTMPIWLYVSFTGVLVYLLIRPYY